MEKTFICSFFGHREVEITDDLYSATYTEILKSVDFGCRVFYFGGLGGFDRLCYEIVTKLQSENPDLNIKRVFCVPQEKLLYKKTRLYRRSDYEETIFLQPSFFGWYKSVYFRNLAMIDDSNYVVFYAENRENSGAYKAYKYALKKKTAVLVNLFPLQPT